MQMQNLKSYRRGEHCVRGRQIAAPTRHGNLSFRITVGGGVLDAPLVGVTDCHVACGSSQ